MRKKKTNIREDILRAIDAAFPDAIVRLSLDPDDDQLAHRYVTLGERLRLIPEAELLFNRAALDDPERWSEGESETFEAPLDPLPYRSYDRFFLGLRDEQFKFTSEDEEEDEEGNLIRIERTGTIGCLVAVSAIAPMAMIRFDEIEQADEYGETEPDIFDHLFSLDGKPLDMEQHYRETFCDEAVTCLHELRVVVIRVLQEQGIAVIPDDQLQNRVSWLMADEDAVRESASMEGPVTVRNAFFFMLP